MHVLPLPKNFPQPQSMGQSPVPTWIRWIREESERIVGDLEEEMQRQKDLDNPFDGTASGIFESLEHDTRAPLIPLPEENKPKQHKQKAEKLRSSLPHTNTSNDARLPIQMAQPRKQRETVQP